MNRYIFLFLIAAFSLLLHAKCVGQNNIVYGAGISYTNGVPTFVPPSKSARVAIDTVTSKWYEYATPGGWRWSGDRVQDISGCATPAYTPGKAQSSLVLNACTEAQNGHGPELYKYTGSAWLCLNCGGNYTAGTGIDITGAEITNTAPDQVVSITGAGINAITGTYPNFTVTGTEVDGSVTNELQTLSVAGNNLTISDGNTVTLPTPSSTLDGLTDVTITTPANNQILQYNTAGGQWVNATLSAITGSGTANTLAKFTDSGVIGNSQIVDNGTVAYLNGFLGINTPTQQSVLTKFEVNSRGRFWNGVEFGQFGAVSIDATGNYRKSIGAGDGFGFYNNLSYTGSAGTYAWGTIETTLAESSGGASVSVLRIRPVINQSGTTNATTIGLDVNATETSVLGPYYAALFRSGQVSVGNATPNTAAKLEITSTTQGVLFPRMTATQRDAIASPPDGLVLYNTTAAKLQVRAASAWVDLH